MLNIMEMIDRIATTIRSKNPVSATHRNNFRYWFRKGGKCNSKCSSHPLSGVTRLAFSTVMGHAGQLVIGELEQQSIMAMQGRVHYYEGYTMQQVTLPVRVMQRLGIEISNCNKCCWSDSSGFCSWRCNVDYRQSELGRDDWVKSTYWTKLG